ncbi:LamG domain-containing protein [Maribacter sp. PR1]|uniref:LamG domain-containing protein n=1 Tax=Maribacter cobaltidurans TaxID=1178778 RepID=A0ABU7IZL2_9FLAO|nr:MULTISPECIES: LamG domain-containing protein [Maribacter]MDC6390953.1 LamG domain-containing protein [Maribacter sp. PR1]MEE1978345.1 LamG domain-containing protein [Maribacter cobaltidurans]
MKVLNLVLGISLLVLHLGVKGQTTDHSNFLNGLVSAYSLESSTSLDDELNTNNGTITGATTVSGNIGNALNFTGSQATMATIPTSTSLDIDGTEITMMVDIYPTANGQSGKSVIVQKGWGSTGDNVYSISYTNTNTIRYRNYIDGVRRDFMGTTTAPLNTWSRIICVWKSGEPRTIRINTATDVEGISFTGTHTVNSGRDVTIGSYDVASPAGTRSFTGNIDNVMIWNRALTTAEQNTLINNNLGFSDFSSSGSGTGSGTTIWSEDNSVASYSGKVGIGTTIPGSYELAVNGEIRAKEIKVETANWPDYVFDKEYPLQSLSQLQEFIKENGHLPNIPSAKIIETDGQNLGEMNRLLLEKIEELTIYILQLKNQYDEQQVQINSLKNKSKYE